MNDLIPLATEDVFALARHWLDQGRRVAVATVIRTQGSVPRPVGSQLIVDATGAMAGSVSGGCIEGAVVEQALKCLEDGEPRVLGMGGAEPTAWDTGVLCGGRVELYLEPIGAGCPLRLPLLERLSQARAERRALALVTDLVTGLKTLVFKDSPVIHGGFGLEGEALALVHSHLEAGQSGVIEPGEEGFLFVHTLLPPRRLVVVGGVHIAQALVAMARLVGYEVTVIEPRRAFAAPDRFSNVVVLEEWPDEALVTLALDDTSAVVTLTHDPKLDDPALLTALRAPTFYVGALGSQRTHERRLERLRHAGVTETDLARIHGPVGLAIQAKTPAEIAVSILADLIAVARGDQNRGLKS